MACFSCGTCKWRGNKPDTEFDAGERMKYPVCPQCGGEVYPEGGGVGVRDGNKLPVFVPKEYQEEMHKLSKCCLMDIAWDLAMRIAGNENPEETIRVLNETAAIIKGYRGDK